MAKIERGEGYTPSERILADLGDQAFLNLWSYPNLFIDKKKNGQGVGKELCDLLVVCGDDVLIFSDKAIAWQVEKEYNVAWPRFFRRAIAASVDQIKGAERWITQFPDRIFTDPACEHKLPISLPAPEKRRIHGIVVAGGAHKACQAHYKDDSGSFIIMPPLTTLEDHVAADGPGRMPFAIGDLNPGGMFIHAFDDVSIRMLLTHLNTISDFTQYLNKRAEYLRSGQLLMAHGEEELLGRYLTISMQTGERAFETKRPKKYKGFVTTTIQGEWASYLFCPGYLEKTLADDASLFWDRLIKSFSDNIVGGTSVAMFGEEPNAADAERALRFMALESRFARRVLGEGVKGAMQNALKIKTDSFARVMLPSNASADPTLAYVILILAYPSDLDKEGGLPGGYEQYRKARIQMLHSYCLTTLHRRPELKTAVGIAIDAHSSQTGRKGGSEDLMALQVSEWTPELLQRIAEAKEHLDIFNEERLVYTEGRRYEYSRAKDEVPKKDKRFKTKK
jgi:hypothetical protein